MKKQNLLNAIVVLGLMSFGIRSNAQSLQVNQTISPNQAVEIAQQGLPNMLQLIEPDDLKDYGFDKKENFANIQIGRPFYVVNLPRTSSTSNNESITVNPSTIMLPLILDAKARCILYVSQEEGSWKVVGIGEGNYVATHQDIFNANANNDGNAEVIVSVPQFSQQYIMLNEKTISFKPLIQFDDNAMEPISLDRLIEINNIVPAEINGLGNLNDAPVQNNQSTKSK